MDEGPAGHWERHSAKCSASDLFGFGRIAIEERHCFPTSWFCFKNRQELDRDNRVPIADGGDSGARRPDSRGTKL